jgi:hypothetical protein
LKAGKRWKELCFLPGISECKNGSSSSPVSSLIIMVVHKDKGSVRRHETPTFSPVPVGKIIIHAHVYSFTID